MKTISADEFKSKYGNDAVKQFAAPTQAPAQPNYLQRVGGDISNNLQQAGSDLTTQDGRSALSKGISAVSHVATAAASPLTEAPGIKQVGQGIGKGIDWLGSKLADTYAPSFDAKLANMSDQEFQQKTQPLTDIANTGNIANTILATEGAVKTIKGVPGTLARKASPISDGAETATSALSRKLYETGIGRNAAEAERTLNYRAAKELGENPTPPTTRATAAQKYGISGRQADIGVQAKVVGTKLFKDQILPELQKSKEIITKDDLFEPLKEKIQKTVDPSRKAELQDAFDALQEDYKGESQWNLEKAQELKSGIDKFTPDKVFKGKPIANAYNELRHDMADAIRSHTYSKLSDVGIKQKYLDYGNLKELQKLGVEGLANNKLKGGAGSFITGLLEKAVTPIATTAGKILYKIDGTPVTFSAETKVKNLNEFLKSKGY